jgi:hypothetical protein
MHPIHSKKEHEMKLPTKLTLLAAAAAIVGGCTPSAETQQMVPASSFVPQAERDVDVTVHYGDEVTELDDALIAPDATGRRHLLLFDGDASCADARVAGVPRGLVLQSELDENGQPTNWTYYQAGTLHALPIGPEQANYRSGPGGGSLSIRSTVDQLPLAIRGKYRPDYCP